jgi:hypothetical protein
MILTKLPEQDSKALVDLSDLPYQLHPTQDLVFRDNEANELLYGGSKGPGKSFLIRYCFCAWAMFTPGVQLYLFRRTHPDLWKNHMEGPSSFPNMLAKCEAKGQCAIIGKEVRWANGARIFLNHLQLERHVTKYQGVEIHGAAFDELTQFTEYQYRYVTGSVRLGSFVPTGPFAHIFPIILNGANPGGISHDFVKSRFIDQGPYEIKHRTEKEEGGFYRQFIPARVEDNPELLKNDPTYLERLEGMGNPELVRAMREGDWEVIAGSMFGYVWRNERHVCEPFAIPATWDIWRGGDDGYNAPASVHWLTQNPDNGTFYVIAEIYEKGLLPDEFAKQTLEMDFSIRINFGDDEVDVNDLELAGKMDSAAFSDTGTGKESRAAQMNRLGCRWRAVEKGTGSRVMRAQMMHKVLAPNPLMHRDHNGVCLPGIRFFSRCTAAIRTIPKLPISEKNPEDVDTTGEDHCFIAGTLIDTEHGAIPIERIEIGDRVRTRIGFEPVLATCKTLAQPVIENAGLTGTPNHKIYDAEQKKWLPLCGLTGLNTVCHQKEWSLTELLTGATQNPTDAKAGFILAVLLHVAKMELGDFTKLSGEQRMAIFRKVATSIMSTGTRSTTLSKIWSALRRFNMRSGMTRQSAELISFDVLRRFRMQLVSGTVLQRVAHGIANTQPYRYERQNRNHSFAHVAGSTAPASNINLDFVVQSAELNGGEIAASMMCRKLVQSANVNSKRADSNRAQVAVDCAEPRLESVYNMTVAGAPEYFANGILVSNCFDSITYGLTEKRSYFMKAKITGI